MRKSTPPSTTKYLIIPTISPPTSGLHYVDAKCSQILFHDSLDSANHSAIHSHRIPNRVRPEDIPESNPRSLGHSWDYTIEGRHQKDPRGEHLTLCFKDEEMVAKGTHVASHGYVNSKTDSNIREATHSPEKADSTITTRTGRPVWPSDRSYEYEIEVAFGHLPDDSELS